MYRIVLMGSACNCRIFEFNCICALVHRGGTGERPSAAGEELALDITSKPQDCYLDLPQSRSVFQPNASKSQEIWDQQVGIFHSEAGLKLLDPNDPHAFSLKFRSAKSIGTLKKEFRLLL
jgi:hypothetical protein